MANWKKVLHESSPASDFPTLNQNTTGEAATVTNGVYTNTASAASFSWIKDEDNMASNSATHLPTQQSVKAYVDAQVDTADSLAEMSDVTITGTPADNEVLAYDNGDGKFINQTAAEAGLITGTAGTANTQFPRIAVGLGGDAIDNGDYAVFTADAGSAGEGLKGLSPAEVRSNISAHIAGGTSGTAFQASTITCVDLTVTGTTTSISTANLEVEDKLVRLATPNSAHASDANGYTAAQNASDGGGIALQTNYGTTDTHFARIAWSKTGKQSGWEIADSGSAGQASTAYTITTTSYSTAAPSGNLNGVGGFHFDTQNDNLYVRISD
jgi:hypothetical protein